MICYNDEFLDKITEAMTLLFPLAFLKFKKINLIIQDSKPPDKPKRPLSLVDLEKIKAGSDPERTN